jgi:uncharacterized protein (TIGR02996 family)
MTSDRQTQRELLRDILTEPDDEAPRLVYADWLEERGDPLGQLVRLGIELQRDYLPRAHRDELLHRQSNAARRPGLRPVGPGE